MVSSMKPTSPKTKHFANQQEAVRKSVERCFAVLFKRFNILYQSSRLFDKSKMVDVAHICCILHNMIAEYRERLVQLKIEAHYPVSQYDAVTNAYWHSVSLGHYVERELTGLRKQQVHEYLCWHLGPTRGHVQYRETIKWEVEKRDSL